MNFRLSLKTILCLAILLSGLSYSVFAQETTHTVEQGETLFSISKQHGVTIAELKAWNDLSGNNLSLGQKLIIYPSESPEQQGTSIVADDDDTRNDYYTVKSGDSLYKIAREHDMSVEELQELNDLSTTNIRVGQRLTVHAQSSAPPSVAETVESSAQGTFATYKIPSGSATLQELLEQFQMDEQEFRALNPDADPNNLRGGQQVTILAPPSRSFENPYITGGSMDNLGRTGVSRYRSGDRGTPTTNGELYNPDALTGAHSNITLGSVIFVRNEQSQKGVMIRINDRTSGSGMKLSRQAWEMLDFKGSNPTVTIYQQ